MIKDDLIQPWLGKLLDKYDQADVEIVVTHAIQTAICIHRLVNTKPLK